ncbi:MAG: spherulation-specific family 4 protein [Verrucomicrobia bacterium]|nr:spherulation-specific family 4 protein [Verrucomicrobiota bacterium]
MKTVWTACLAAFVLLPALADGLALMVPAYFGPRAGGDWDRLTAAARRVPLIAILNPASGPGDAVNPQYTRAIQAVRSAGGRVTGYVSTAYGRRVAEAVKEDIRRYHDFYTLDGFFLDEMSNDGSATSLAYYADLRQHILRLNPAYHITGNPGTTTQESYVTRPTADTVVTFEDGTGYPGYSPSAWTKRHPAHRFCHLLHSVAETSALTNAVRLAQSRNAGFLYVTDDVLNNPWDRLPAYWDAEVNLVERANRDAAEARPPRLDLKHTGGDGARLEIHGTAGRYIVLHSPSSPATMAAAWLPLATNLTFTGELAYEPLLFTPRPMALFHARVE